MAVATKFVGTFGKLLAAGGMLMVTEPVGVGVCVGPFVVGVGV
jgi:hypothetical protein